jgi:hypothetical protein
MVRIANHSAESKDPMPAKANFRRIEAFSPSPRGARLHRENTSKRQGHDGGVQGSFDYMSSFASG